MRRVLVRAAAVLAVLLVLLTGYGVLVEPRLLLDERRIQAALPGLPEQSDETEVAFLSDLQVGMWWANTGMVEDAVAAVVAAKPDAVLLGGDFLYSRSPDPSAQIRTVMGLLEPLTSSGTPVYAVMGNHDHSVGAVPELTAALEEAGVAVLTNESAVVPGTGQGTSALRVVGLGPVRPGLVDVGAALDDVPADAPRVVLMHNPTAFPELPAGSAPLALAGHTHCGQVALPGTPRWSYLGLTEEEKLVADGFAPDGYGADGNALFVSCGIGFSALPVRINARPQIVLVELRPGPPSAG